MVNRKTASALKLAALPLAAVLASSFSTQSVAAWFTPAVAPVIAQASSFPVPDSVAKGTELQISSGSDNMNSITEALKGGFESEYGNASVSVDAKAADAAISDVLNGNADLAAISRPLTDEEKAQGLESVAARREKIAIIVGENNPFAQSITGSQFAQIFRGEITNWQEVGGPDKPIRFIDRPQTSETRQALNPYPVFVSQPFETGSTATQVSEDSLEAIANELGDDGISYALVGQLEDASNVKAVQLHQTLPDDPRYPFSQPYSFVYAGAASAPVKAFLGYATGAPGQATLEGAGLPGYAVAPTGGSATGGTDSAAAGAGGSAATGADGDATAGADGSATADADGNATGTDVDAAAGADGSTIDPATGNIINADGTVTDADGNIVTLEDGETAVVDGELDDTAVDADGAAGAFAGRGKWWWLLLPLAGLGLLIWAASKRGAEEETGYTANAGDDAIRTNYTSGGGTTGGTGGRYGTSEVGGKVGAGVGRAVAGGTALAGGAAAAGAGLASRAGKGLSTGAGDVTMDLDGIKGSAQAGIDSVKGSTQGGLGNLRSNIQGGVDGARSGIQGGMGNLKSNVQGGIDSAKGGLQGGIDGIKGRAQDGASGLKGSLDTSIDGIKGRAQGGIDGVRGGIGDGVNQVKGQAQDGVSGLKGKAQDGIAGARTKASETSGSWLDRAKQRINQAADEATDKAGDLKDKAVDKATDIKDDVTGNS